MADLAEEGEAVPTALINQPETPDHLTFVWDAFWRLTGDRSLGFGVVGPIPWSAISAYADRAGIRAADEFDRFLTLVRALDEEYRDHLRRERDKT